MKLSIISPVYGVEFYIEFFLKSLLCQLTAEVELILVNDGTNDNSIKLAENLINSIPNDIQKNIIILHQRNQGQSVARNTALQYAKGEYIGFLDPDDYVEPNYISRILELLTENPDVVSFGAKAFLDKSNKVLHEIYTDLSEGFNEATHDLLSQIYMECNWMPWLRVFKRVFLKDTNFPVGMLLEDVYLFSMLYLEVKTINHSNEVLVNYRIRKGSSVSNKSDLFFQSYTTVIDYLIVEKFRNPYLIDLTINKLMRAFFEESVNSRGLCFGFSNIRKYKKNKKYILYILNRSFMYLIKKVIGRKS